MDRLKWRAISALREENCAGFALPRSSIVA
jgi:hypothetical protein